jgi:hypothetical protein
LRKPSLRDDAEPFPEHAKALRVVRDHDHRLLYSRPSDVCGAVDKV